jgi:hypothetical protein
MELNISTHSESKMASIYSACAETSTNVARTTSRGLLEGGVIKFNVMEHYPLDVIYHSAPLHGRSGMYWNYSFHCQGKEN